MYEFLNANARGFANSSLNGCFLRSFDVAAFGAAPRYRVSPSDNSCAFPFLILSTITSKSCAIIFISCSGGANSFTYPIR